jgi:hypothetical protein
MKVSRITLFLFGGVSNLTAEPPTPMAELKMAIAGPITSLLIGLLLTIGVSIISPATEPEAWLSVFQQIGYINLLLAAFNLLPGFPLDGGRIFRAILWHLSKNQADATEIATTSGQIIAVIIIITGALQLIFAGIVTGLWLVFIGLFLYQVAKNSKIQSQIKTYLKNYQVADFINPLQPKISATATLEEMYKDAILQKKRYFIVTDKTEIVGIADLAKATNTPRESWPRSNVRSIVVGFDKLNRLDGDSGADILLETLGINEPPVAPVYNKEGVFQGIVTDKDLEFFLTSIS